MSGTQKTSVVILALLLCASFCSPARADRPKHKSHKAAAKQAEPPPQAAPVAPPPPPPTPEQMPAVPAQVTYQNSQLTILARNSTLGDILRAVHKQTGANMDAPPNATQRIVGQFGPGPARDVLASVLDASDFNYVLLGSPTNPNTLARVIITAKSSTPVPNNAVAQAAPQPADENPADTSSDDTDQPPPSESFVPQDNQPQDNQASDQNNGQEQNGNPQKSPEQLLQELQRQQMMQQQQLQQQQQQNQGGDTSQQPNQMQQQQR